MISSNAIIVARVPEGDLSSTVAVVQMQQRVGQVVSAATMLAIIEATGSISNPDSYRPVWLLIVVLAIATCAVCMCVPKDFTKSSGGYTKLDMEEVDEAGHLLDDDIGEENGHSVANTSIYGQRDETAPSKTLEAEMQHEMVTLRSKGGETVKSAQLNNIGNHSTTVSSSVRQHRRSSSKPLTTAKP